MDISLGHVFLALCGVVVACVLFRYLRFAMHLVVLAGKLGVVGILAFVVVYASGIWRPDLSPVVWVLSKLLRLIGQLAGLFG
jgi:hypothetical protein